MPAAAAIAAIVGAGAAVAGTVNAKKAAKAQEAQAQQAADLARRQAAATNQANAMALTRAAQRDQLAVSVEADTAAATAQLNETPDAALATAEASPSARRRQVRSQFRLDGGSDASGSLRL